jgi:hypothetical protein
LDILKTQDKAWEELERPIAKYIRDVESKWETLQESMIDKEDKTSARGKESHRRAKRSFDEMDAELRMAQEFRRQVNKKTKYLSTLVHEEISAFEEFTHGRPDLCLICKEPMIFNHGRNIVMPFRVQGCHHNSVHLGCFLVNLKRSAKTNPIDVFLSILRGKPIKAINDYEYDVCDMEYNCPRCKNYLPLHGGEEELKKPEHFTAVTLSFAEHVNNNFVAVVSQLNEPNAFIRYSWEDMYHVLCFWNVTH